LIICICITKPCWALSRFCHRSDVFVKVESGRLVLEVIDPQAKAA
jgi:hypothetical protein